jgi:hypothetical protein
MMENYAKDARSRERFLPLFDLRVVVSEAELEVRNEPQQLSNKLPILGTRS